VEERATEDPLQISDELEVTFTELIFGTTDITKLA
jgi:hypothetical protein